MKKVSLIVMAVLLMAVAGSKAFAQEPVAYKVYCEITAVNRAFSEKKTVEVDFGQASSFWSNDRRLADENGKAIIFNSMLDAANYMARRGWDLEEAYIENKVSNGTSMNPVFHWVMSKMVTSEDQITEGFKTVGMSQ